MLSGNSMLMIRWMVTKYVIRGRAGKALAALLLLWGTKKLYGNVSLFLHSRKMERSRENYRAYCKRSLKKMEDKVKQANISRDELDRIISLDLETLIGELQKGHLRPSRVLTAYQAKALEVHSCTNCLIHAFEEADAMAEALDNADEQTRNKPLFGVPLSVKDDYGVKGYGAALGMANILHIRVEEDCQIIKVLKNAGAVPFVKTNTPHAAFSLLCSNPVTGETKHPMDNTRTPGGSSGGEAALIGGGGSILGVGSDIGGSLREPSAFCGLCTIRPTVDRLSFAGLPHCHYASGQHRMCTSYGPMARDVASVVRFCRTLFIPDLYETDMFAAPVPFNEELYAKNTPMRVGVFSGEQLFPVSPPARRALREAREALESLGHTVVDWNPEDMYTGVHYYMRTVSATSAADFIEFMRGDPPDWCLKDVFEIMPGPDSWTARARIKLSSIMDPHYGALKEHCIGTNSVSDYWKDTVGLHEFRQYMEKSFRDAGLDCVICPGFPSCAPVSEERTYLQLIYMHAHTLLWNSLNVPCGTVPVTQVKESDFAEIRSWKPDCSPWVKDKTQADLLTGVGLPLGVMVCALRWKDETVLRTMSEIEKGLKLSTA